MTNKKYVNIVNMKGFVMEFNKKVTHRGFSYIEFKDRYGVECNIQKSSLATEDAIWFGCAEANPKVCIAGKGWVPFEVPSDVSFDTRMHLTQEQVKELLPILQEFVKTGELPS